MGTQIAALQEKDDKLNVRLPKGVKKQLLAQAKAKGFPRLSAYVRAILIDNAKK